MLQTKHENIIWNNRFNNLSLHLPLDVVGDIVLSFLWLYWLVF